MVCGRDSDGDGYPDMKLDCDNNPQCEKVCNEYTNVYYSYGYASHNYLSTVQKIYNKNHQRHVHLFL